MLTETSAARYGMLFVLEVFEAKVQFTPREGHRKAMVILLLRGSLYTILIH